MTQEQIKQFLECRADLINTCQRLCELQDEFHGTIEAQRLDKSISYLNMCSESITRLMHGLT